MIQTFACKETQKIFDGLYSTKLPPEIQDNARRKLLRLHAASSINELRIPPSNHLERLRGDRAGQHSIRINSQWRICFVFRDGNAYAVEIVDYHG